MKLYRPTYKDRKGRKKKCSEWHLNFIDRKSIRRRLAVSTNKQATRDVADRIESLLMGKMDRDLQQWIQGIPEKLRNKLIGFGVIDGRMLPKHFDKTLSEHINDFYEHLRARESTEHYRKQAKSIITKVFADCGFVAWADIDRDKVERSLKGLRDNGIGVRTSNLYLTMIKRFCSWMYETERADTKPLARLKAVPQSPDSKRCVRRALTLDEQIKLLRTTASGETHSLMTGYERYLLYKLTLQTGLRAKELRSLTVSSFNFNDCLLTVLDTKNKKPAVISLKKDTALELKTYLAGKMPDTKAFRFAVVQSRMIKKDLESAGIEYETYEGTVDFHSLRHTFITNLAHSGVHPKDAQTLARHSTITLTMDYYTHTTRESIQKITDNMPDLSIGEKAVLTVA